MTVAEAVRPRLSVADTVPQALASAEVSARGLVTRIPHPEAGWVPNLTPPARLKDTPVVDPVPAPRLGQHTQDVLKEVLGFDDQRIAQLKAAGAFGAG